MTGAAHTAETEKMLNLEKNSDGQEKKEEKKQTDPVALHGEETGGKPHATEVDGPHEDKPTKVVD
ncbi:hypothetical protein NliqN6_3893 [Naganishia liquefaciens]|uniref:Uncharacterized protein n=1 Tax=Naganishia liquefaciens TaxID=104408 RepID=A0A8H3YHB8_9TREE|nr:hypothetical protein NliqN6_3893 [Naganishia liquefaciens]